MKFLTFNIVVLGALFFLYHFGSGSTAPLPEAAQEPTHQAESSAQESAVVNALADRVAGLARSVARLESHVSEVIQRKEAAVAGAAAPPRPRKKVQPTSEPAPETPAQSASASPRKPRPEAPRRPAAAPTEGAASYAAARGTAPDQPASSAQSAGSEFRSDPKVATRDLGSEWSDGGATGAPVHSGAGAADSQPVASAGDDVPVIDGELMTPSQRRHALLELAQDMELHYLASAGE